MLLISFGQEKALGSSQPTIVIKAMKPIKIAAMMIRASIAISLADNHMRALRGLSCHERASLEHDRPDATHPLAQRDSNHRGNLGRLLGQMIRHWHRHLASGEGCTDRTDNCQ
jgi:hypothetical protein